MNYDLLVAGNPVWELAWLVDSIPESGLGWGEIPRGSDGLADGGGSALNSACALAAAGRRVLAAGQVGDDEDGRAAVEALRRRGVETRIAFCAGRTTKRNHLYVDRSTRETAFQVFLPSRAVPPYEEEPPALLDAAVFLLDRLPVAAEDWLNARSGMAGGWSFLSRNSSVGTPANEDRFRRALPWITALQIPEAAEGTGQGGNLQKELLNRSLVHRPAEAAPLSPAAAEELLRAGVRVLLRTRGAQGVRVQVRSSAAGSAPCLFESWDIAARSVELVDPTGAGDAFTAGFIDARLDGRSPREAAERGLEWAARACRHLGARGWLDHEPPERRKTPPS